MNIAMVASKSILLLLFAILAISTKAFTNVNTPAASISITKTSLLLQSKVSSLQQRKVPSSSQLSMSDKPEIEVVSNPDKEFLDKKGVFNWGTWGCGVSKFPWTYDQTESCYLLAGKVTVTPSDGRASATFGKGDFVTFPAGMSCTWDVSEAVEKHFMFY